MNAAAVNKDYTRIPDTHNIILRQIAQRVQLGPAMGSVLYQSIRLVFGTLYPAYSSFKAVKSKNVKVGWSMVIS